jgi:hypothetical protein
MAQKPRNRQGCGQPTSEVQLLSSDSVHAALLDCLLILLPVCLQPLGPWFVRAAANGELGRLAVSEAGQSRQGSVLGPSHVQVRHNCEAGQSCLFFA